MQLLRRFLSALMLVFAFAFVGSPYAKASSISINATFASSITSDPNAALIENTINSVVNFYESVITAPITVNITYAEMTTGLGSSSTYYSTISYNQYLAALQAHSSGDAVDVSALASLPAGPDNPVNGSQSVDVTTANLRALGFNINLPTDSTVAINTSITNYAGTPYNPGFYSLIGVVEHETDEALGLGSDLDSGNTSGAIRPEDLFRYSAPGVRSYTTSSLASSYFSINGGVTDLIGFNQVGGDSDYGDWVTSGTAHVQDAFGTLGASPTFSIDEQDALDAIGYNFVQPPAATPEPSSIWLLTTGALGLVGYRHRRRATR